PSSVTSPSCGSRSASARSSKDFPAPDGPVTHTHSPASSSRSSGPKGGLHSPRAASRAMGSDRVGTGLPGADAQGLFEVEDEDFAVAYLAGAGGPGDGLDDPFGEVVG